MFFRFPPNKAKLMDDFLYPQCLLARPIEKIGRNWICNLLTRQIRSAFPIVAGSIVAPKIWRSNAYILLFYTFLVLSSSIFPQLSPSPNLSISISLPISSPTQSPSSSPYLASFQTKIIEIGEAHRTIHARCLLIKKLPLNFAWLNINGNTNFKRKV
jgi:hypothetical protein